jgi:N-dimethylarginine dimethylaminohydrolase
MMLRSRLDGGGTPLAAPWGADSEYGVLREVLLGPADHFAWRPANAIAQRTARLGVRYDHQTAMAQHRELAQAFEAADVIVRQLPPDPVLPYLIYARDTTVMTPWGALVMQMERPFRRGEPVACIRYYAELGVPIWDVVTAGSAEGGDLMVLKPGVAISGLSGVRSSEEGVRQVRAWFETEGWNFKTYEFDPHFLHLDVQLAMVAEGLALACRDAVEPELIDWLKVEGVRVLDVPYGEAMRMGCNAVALGGDRVMVARQNRLVAELCRAEGLTVFDPDISMIAAAGGSIHCLCQPLRRDPAAR